MWTWNQLGRRVKRGEKGIAILAPLIAKLRKDEAKSNDETSNGRPALLGFRRVYVWDETQTEGAPLPQLEKVTGEAGVYLDRLRDYVLAQGITLEFDESIAPALGMAGVTTIRIFPGQMSEIKFYANVSMDSPASSQNFASSLQRYQPFLVPASFRPRNSRS